MSRKKKPSRKLIVVVINDEKMEKMRKEVDALAKRYLKATLAMIEWFSGDNQKSSDKQEFGEK